MLDELRDGLGDFNFRWLQACSALPALRLPITLHLGAALAKADGRPPPTESEAVALFNLPWFRQGWMPAELRPVLLGAQSEDDWKTTRAALRSLSFNMVDSSEVDALGGVTVSKVREPPNTWEAIWASWLRGLPAHLAEKDLEEKARADVLGALNSARNKSPAPTNTDIKAKLDAAGNALEAADGAATKAVHLVKTISTIGKWVIAALV